MQISFVTLSFIALYEDNHVCACVRLLFFSLKNSSSETIDWIFYQISKECSLDTG